MSRGPASFGQLLREHRIAAALAQEELAERAALSRRAISDLERGAHKAPYPATVRRLAEALALTESQTTALLIAARGSTVDQSSTPPVPRVSIEESQKRGRVKYEVLGLGTRAAALHGLGRTRAAIRELQVAVPLARRVGDPAQFVRAASGLLAFDGEESLAAEAEAARSRITTNLPDTGMREGVLAGNWSVFG